MSAQLYTQVARLLPLAPSQAVRSRLVAAIQGKASVDDLSPEDRALILSLEAALDAAPSTTR